MQRRELHLPVLRDRVESLAQVTGAQIVPTGKQMHVGKSRHRVFATPRLIAVTIFSVYTIGNGNPGNAISPPSI